MGHRPSIPHPRITVLGVGNPLLRDEGSGIRVVEYLKESGILPGWVDLIDGGTAGMRLLSLFQDIDHLIIVDAVKCGGSPGDIYRFTIEDIPLKVRQKTSLHEIGLQEVFSILNLLEKKMPETVIIGVEPKEVGYGLGLTPEVERVIPDIALMVKQEVEGLLGKGAMVCSRDI